MKFWLLCIAAILDVILAADTSTSCDDGCYLTPYTLDNSSLINVQQRFYLYMASEIAELDSLPGYCGKFETGPNCTCTFHDAFLYEGDVFLFEYSYNTVEERFNSHLYLVNLPCYPAAVLYSSYDFRLPGYVYSEDIATDNYHSWIVEKFCKFTENGAGQSYTWVWSTTTTPDAATLDAINAAIAAAGITDTLIKINQEYCDYPSATYTTDDTDYFAG